MNIKPFADSLNSNLKKTDFKDISKPELLPEYERLMREFISDLRWMDGLSSSSLQAYQTDLRQFFLGLQAQRIGVFHASAAQIEQFLSEPISPEKSHLKGSSLARKRSAIKRFYQWAQQKNHCLDNPCDAVLSPQQAPRLPKSLSESAVEALLEAPDVTTAVGVRDRAMLELMYGAGLRVSELVGLKVSQINLNLGALIVLGKRSKERMLPYGQEASHWLNEYLSWARADLLGGEQEDALWVAAKRKASSNGLTRQMFWILIKQYARQANLNPLPSPHSLRHSFATHLLNHGADLKSLQQLLGHASVTTTEIYTYVANERLKMIYHQHHPRGDGGETL